MRDGPIFVRMECVVDEKFRRCYVNAFISLLLVHSFVMFMRLSDVISLQGMERGSTLDIIDDCNDDGRSGGGGGGDRNSADYILF